MARKRNDKPGMTVYPSAPASAALGEFKTRELTTALRVCAVMITQASAQIADTFTPAEWERLAALLAERSVEPEVTNPGPLLADLVTYEMTGRAKAPGKGQPLTERLHALTYAQAWALLIAIRFRCTHDAQIPEGAHWWTVPVRRAVLSPDLEMEDGQDD